MAEEINQKQETPPVSESTPQRIHDYWRAAAAGALGTVAVGDALVTGFLATKAAGLYTSLETVNLIIRNTGATVLNPDSLETIRMQMELSAGGAIAGAIGAVCLFAAAAAVAPRR